PVWKPRYRDRVTPDISRGIPRGDRHRRGADGQVDPRFPGVIANGRRSEAERLAITRTLEHSRAGAGSDRNARILSRARAAPGVSRAYERRARQPHALGLGRIGRP